MEKLNQRKSFSILGIIVFLTLVYFPVFLHLDRLPLANFDEARLAVSALEMDENGNWLIPHFGGKPDMWSTKPPLMIWFQTVCIKVLGINELAIRLPSALATLFTVFLLVFFSKKYLNRPLIGILAALVLVTIKGFIVKHVSRTGDYDALLVFFMTVQALLFWLFTEAENEEKRRKYILLFGLSVALSVLTKSVVGLMFLPAFFLYVSVQRKIKKALFYKWTLFAITIALILISGYYFLRENYNPGYLQAVWENELGGRYLGTLEKHKEPFGWYFERLIFKQFVPWIYLFPIAIWLGFKSNPKIKRLTYFSILTALSFLLIISVSNTKLEHYDAPIYPFLALLTGIGLVSVTAKFIWQVKKYLNTYFNQLQSSQFFNTVLLILILLIFAYPYYKIIDSIYLQEPSKQYNEYGWFMRRNQDTKTYFVAVKNYNAHLEFYKQAYNRKGYKIETTYPKNLESGNIAMFCQNNVKKIIDDYYEYQIKDTDRGCFLIEITAKR